MLKRTVDIHYLRYGSLYTPTSIALISEQMHVSSECYTTSRVLTQSHMAGVEATKSQVACK